MTTPKRRFLTAIVTLILALCILSVFLVSFITIVQARTIRIACIGDSITEGSYPKKLQGILGKDYKVGSFGSSGSTVLLDSDKPYMNQSAFVSAKFFQPSVVVIMLGTNDAHESNYDSLDNFLTDYENLVNQYQTLETSPEIWLVKPPPIFDNNLNLNNTSLKQEIIPKIEQAASELNLPMIDVNAALSGYPQYFGDGVHPDENGALVIANEIIQAINANSVIATP